MTIIANLIVCALLFTAVAALWFIVPALWFRYKTTKLHYEGDYRADLSKPSVYVDSEGWHWYPAKQVVMEVEIAVVNMLLEGLEAAYDNPEKAAALGELWYTKVCEDCKIITMWSVDPGGSGHSMCTECNLME